MGRELWVIEGSEGPLGETTAAAEALSFFSLADAEAEAEHKTHAGERVTRYVPAPVWRKFDPQKPPAAGCHLCETDNAIPDVLCWCPGSALWMDCRGTTEQVYRYTDLPTPPPEDE